VRGFLCSVIRENKKTDSSLLVKRMRGFRFEGEKGGEIKRECHLSLGEHAGSPLQPEYAGEADWRVCP